MTDGAKVFEEDWCRDLEAASDLAQRLHEIAWPRIKAAKDKRGVLSVEEVRDIMVDAFAAALGALAEPRIIVTADPATGRVDVFVSLGHAPLQ